MCEHQIKQNWGMKWSKGVEVSTWGSGLLGVALSPLREITQAWDGAMKSLRSISIKIKLE